MSHTHFKKLVLGSLVAAACVAGSAAQAHTGIKVKTFAEGLGNVQAGSAGAYNDFTVTHGCATNAVAEGTTGATRLDVIAMAALFPNSDKAADTKIYRYKTGSIAAGVAGVDGTVLTGAATTLPVVSPMDLTDDINGAVAGAGLNMGLGLVSPNLFGNVIVPKLNATGVVRGYAVASGAVQILGNGNANAAPLSESVVSTTGLSPFKFTVPTFKSTSCAANLVVRVAVSNWCQRGGASKNSDDRKDVWIGTDTGSVLYSMTGPNHGIMPNSRTTMGMTSGALSEQGNGKSFWPAFTVARDLVKNPLPSTCNGESYDVVIEPNGADIDTNLTIDKAPYPKGINSAVYY